ncbi:TPR domain protein, putative component of TonB system [Pseudoalteromonas luteoviolacea B = ATCC 29581]|nr:TPR domain protein, putative component of TonB system [Pseudoalteromonas luteoviolacea B = ATCC 29581]
MKKIVKVSLFAVAFSVTYLLPPLISTLPSVDIGVAHAETKTKRVPALREKVYSQLARAQKLADDGDVKAGLEALDSVKDRMSSMNAYEVAMMYNFYGFIYYNQNDLSKAIASFEQVIAQDAIPETLALSTTFSLAQLAMANEQYNKVIEYLTDWDAINTKPKPDNYFVLKSQAYYQMKEYSKALENIQLAINLSENLNQIPNENWLVLQRALYYSMNQPKNVVLVLEKMVKLYSKPEYWVQLGGMYGEIGEDKKQLAILESAKQQGYIRTKNDYQLLAQAYLMSGLPYKAAATYANAITLGVIDSSSKNNAFIAESFVQAKEEAKAVEYFIAAAKKVEHGKYDQRLAEVYLTLEKYEEAADSARAALDKGQLDSESTAFVALGMAQYNLQNFDASILAFEQAEKHKRAQRLAQQWIKYVKNEKVHFETLKTALL